VEGVVAMQPRDRLALHTLHALGQTLQVRDLGGADVASLDRHPHREPLQHRPHVEELEDVLRRPAP
jgi:hypothetical protein